MSGHTAFTVTEEDVVEAARHVAARRLRSRPFLPIFVAMLAAVLALVLIADFGQGRWVTLIAFFIALPLALIIANRLIVPWQAKRHFRQAAALRGETRVEWDDENLRFEGIHGGSRFAWIDFHGWAETAGLVLLYQSELFYNLVPKRVLTADQLADIRNCLETAKVLRR